MNAFKIMNHIIDIADMALNDIENWINTLLSTINESSNKPISVSAFFFFYKCIE